VIQNQDGWKYKKHAKEQGLNSQFTVDSDSGIVLGVDVVSDPTDHHQLILQIENLQNNGFDLTNTKILADSIYGTKEALEYLEKNGLDAYISKQETSNHE
jgi:hypothetical protein